MALAYNLPQGPKQKLSREDQGRLLYRLHKFRMQSLLGEEDRQAVDRKGANMYTGRLWEGGVTAGRLAITVMKAKALVERLASMMTKYWPIPVVAAINGNDDKGAALISAGVMMNWLRENMQMLIKRGARLCAFTRPILWYVWWDANRREIGDFRTRLVPAHKCIIDNRYFWVREMEFVGIRERATRASLIELFPDKAREIELAVSGGAESVIARRGDPLNRSIPGTGPTLARVVSFDQGQTFQGKTTYRTSSRGRKNPLAEEVDVEYLWIRDHTPERLNKPALDLYGRPRFKIVRNEAGEIQWDVTGYETIEVPGLGPVLQPKLEVQREPLWQPEVRRKYRHRRYIVWIPGDDIILLDASWNGPVPLTSQRDDLPLDGYWSEGKALRLTSLSLAMNVLYTIIFDRLKLSLGGSWFATASSGIAANKLVPEAGMVYKVRNIDAIKPIEYTVLDAAYFQLARIIEDEMRDLLGISSPMQGEAAGRADSPTTYDKLIEQGGSVTVDTTQMLELTIQEWAEIAVWYMQTRYTHEHMVEVELDDGTTTWESASALATRGEFSVKMEVASMIAWSETAMWERAKEYHQMGIYALPMMVKVGHVPHGREALKQMGQLRRDPSRTYLIGAAAQPALPGQRQPARLGPSGRRSHHAPGR